ncbi:MAG: hypothetical protein EOP43_03775 [Sphingobacteriaceae bacterium]|nr:MAG: hypothetical protein EOP43_03775 [Sphingobacteriaceae bacterium]
MKKLIYGIGVLIAISACNQTNTTQSKTTDTISTSKNSIKYTCPMHPEIVKDKPGVCEKCGMELVKK